VVVVWDEKAKAELRKAYSYILLSSLQNAEKVRDDIIDLTFDLPNHPDKHPVDRFKTNNDGSWRAFEKHHYRISYKVTSTQIRIIRIRHTSQSPLKY